MEQAKGPEECDPKTSKELQRETKKLNYEEPQVQKCVEKTASTSSGISKINFKCDFRNKEIESRVRSPFLSCTTKIIPPASPMKGLEKVVGPSKFVEGECSTRTISDEGIVQNETKSSPMCTIDEQLSHTETSHEQTFFQEPKKMKSENVSQTDADTSDVFKMEHHPTFCVQKVKPVREKSESSIEGCSFASAKSDLGNLANSVEGQGFEVEPPKCSLNVVRRSLDAMDKNQRTVEKNQAPELSNTSASVRMCSGASQPTDMIKPKDVHDVKRNVPQVTSDEAVRNEYKKHQKEHKDKKTRHGLCWFCK